MPPRGRPRKKNTRMDAALDALKPMGFTRQRIHSAVKGLLKEYGGDDGWPFIEEGYYRVLLEELLKGESQQRIEDDVKDAGAPQNMVAEESNVEPTDTTSLIPLSEEEANNHMTEHALQLQSDEGDVTKLPLSGSVHPIEEDLNEYTSDHALPEDTETGTTLQACGSGDITCGNQTGVHRPCHGWIDDYDDQDKRLVQLVPGHFAQEVERLQLGRIRIRGRKRWDVKLSDMEDLIT